MRYVIVGNGVAGTKAAESLRRRDRGGEIMVLSRETVPFYRRPSLVEHLVGRVSQEELLGRPESFYREKDIELRLGTEVVGIDAQAHQVTLADGETLDYDRLLLAVGLSRPSQGRPGSELKGVLSLLTLRDVAALQSAARNVRQALVLGEGVLGLAMAQAFRLLGLEVTYPFSGSRFWPQVLNPEAAFLVEQRLRSEGVKLRPEMQVVEFLGQGGRLRAVRTASGDEIPCQVAGVADGLRPPIEWAREAGLAAEQQVWVDDRLGTSLPDVYAAGDAVRLSDEPLAFGWLRAWHQGVTAAVNMSGGNAPYRRRTASLSTRAFGLPILVMGHPHPQGKVRREHGDYPSNGVYKELLIDSLDRVVGATMVGEVSEASHVEPLVRQQTPFKEVPAEILRRLFDQRYWAAAGAEVLCPVCKFLMHISEEDLQQGRLTCPICGVEFNLRATGDRFQIIMEE
ncbi:MAG: FAD-dependent oxidoreductase [Chloroflexia bacterium]|nr:FAD-dependent oxidoreductase [Chloroflexia bacterium]